MSSPGDPLERVRQVNPVPSEVEPDWARVTTLLATAGDDGPDASAPAHRRWGPSGVGGLLVGLALCGVVATIAVLALAPSGGSSDFLARAASALAPPRGTILYERWTTTIEPEPGNSRREQAETFGPDQLWIESDHPHRYRTVLLPLGWGREEASGEGGAGLAYSYGVSLGFVGAGFDPHTGGLDVPDLIERSISGLPFELGGSVEAPTGTTRPGTVRPTFTYLPSSNTLLRARLRAALGVMLPGPHDQIVEDGADPVGVLRGAIVEGRARLAGTTRLAGRTVQRIDIHLPQQLPADAPPLPPGHPAIHSEAFAYVEPETFHPVEIVYGGQTDRFLAYEYLPATAANRALTDIRAQHPRARIHDAVQPPSRRHSGHPRRLGKPSA